VEANPFNSTTTDWGVDVVVSGSHKGFMLPPGLSFIAVSDKAFSLVEISKSPRYYFDLRKSKKTFAATDTPFTPAIGLVLALEKALEMMEKEGIVGPSDGAKPREVLARGFEDVP